MAGTSVPILRPRPDSEAGGRPWQSAQPANLDDWRLLSDLYATEPVAPRDRMMFALLAPLGISPGLPLNPDALQAQILTEAAQLGDLIVRTIADDKRTPGATVSPGMHWEYAVLFDLDQESPDKRRLQFDERSFWFYEAIGMSLGMPGPIVGFGQVHLEAPKDVYGQWLDGGRIYRTRLPAGPPVKQFGSITLDDNLTRGPVITPQGAADLSSRNPDRVTNADGSLDVFFGPMKPAGATNWISTILAKGWFSYFCLYGPTEAYFVKTWQLHDIEMVGVVKP